MAVWADQRGARFSHPPCARAQCRRWSLDRPAVIHATHLLSVQSNRYSIEGNLTIICNFKACKDNHGILTCANTTSTGRCCRPLNHACVPLIAGFAFVNSLSSTSSSSSCFWDYERRRWRRNESWRNFACLKFTSKSELQPKKYLMKESEVTQA